MRVSPRFAPGPGVLGGDRPATLGFVEVGEDLSAHPTAQLLRDLNLILQAHQGSLQVLIDRTVSLQDWFGERLGAQEQRLKEELRSLFAGGAVHAQHSSQAAAFEITPEGEEPGMQMFPAAMQEQDSRKHDDEERRHSTKSDSRQSLDSHTSYHAPDMVDGALDLRKKHGKRNSQLDMALTRFIERYPIRGYFRRMVRTPWFDILFALFVTTSVVLIGVEIECVAQGWEVDWTVFLKAQCVCCFMFILELGARLTAFGKDFFVGKEWKWNMFDLICTMTMIVDILLEITTSIQAGNGDDVLSSSSTGRILRVIRLLRIVRALRIMRATRGSRELRKMSYALQYSAHTLVWALLLLCFVMYFFATAFTQATTDHVASFDGGVDNSQLLDFYGTLPRSFYSLFLAVASGRDWWELVEPLVLLDWPFVMLFIAFVSVTVFGVMNVVTSVFVESALQSTQHYKDLLIQESLKSKKMYMDHLLEVFHEIDADMSGSVTLEELEQFLLDPGLRMYLESMDIQPDDARTLFRLLDKDDSGQVSIEEFCQGCLRLKGEAKSFDIHCIIFENHRIIHKWRDFMNYLEKGFGPMLTKAVEQAFDNRLGNIKAAGLVVDYGGMHLRNRAREHTAGTSGGGPPELPRPSVRSGVAANGRLSSKDGSACFPWGDEAEAGAGPSPFKGGKLEQAGGMLASAPVGVGGDTGADDTMPNTPYKSSGSQ